VKSPIEYIVRARRWAGRRGFGCVRVFVPVRIVRPVFPGHNEPLCTACRNVRSHRLHGEPHRCIDDARCNRAGYNTNRILFSNCY